ncbi:YlbD family protein [Virgibacillus sp. C22-A2]|uniref:YlbD family protein n=1 Tax=Virgibacillus tibetensis TaxID=3042313 RepID=A0ABU6KEE7_9BACI|nr:YlbD family protein [Virgibacillus sp. C22-A2]
MSDQELHPSVVRFKNFINKHPKLLEEVRRNGRSWQEYYEKWTLLGDDDPLWEHYKQDDSKELDDEDVESEETKDKSELFGQLMKMTEKMDMEKVQKQVQQLSSTITTIQEGLTQFKQTKNTQPAPKEPFNWFRD